MAAGQLPNFSKLAENGTFAPLTPSNPAISPVSWTNIGTGTKSADHGIYDFLHRDPKTYIPYIALRKTASGITGTKFSQPRKRDGFWIHASEAGVPTSIIRWPGTFPAEKVNGRFLSGLGVPDLVGNEGRYLYYTTAPLPAADPSPHNVIKVIRDGNAVRTILRGPAIGRNKFAELPLKITRKNAVEADIDLNDLDTIKARKGKWTGFVRVKFRVGFRKVSGIVKFLVVETEPDLKLYVSPIQLDPVNQMFPITYPESYGKDLVDDIGLFHTLGLPEMVHPLSHGRYGYDEFLAEVTQIEKERTQMFELELERFDEGLLGFVFDHTDRVQHAFWSILDKGHPAHDPRDAEKYGDVIPSLYRKMDSILGKAIEKDDDKTMIMVMSDHGFNSFRYNVHMNRWLIKNGFMELQNKSTECEGLFRGVDWSKTKAYAVGFASIYVNVAGREGNGTIKSREEYDKICGEIAAKLKDFEDPRNGNMIVNNIYFNGAKTGSASESVAPDILVGFNRNYRMSWQTAIGGAPQMLIDDNTEKWSGDHIIDPELLPGIFFCNKKINNPNLHNIDIAPTVLKCLGIDSPNYMKGTALL